MSKPNDGGPAFPVSKDTLAMHEDWRGMTLRDYFAAKALVGILSYGRKGGPEVCDNAARDAYDFADAMLAERAKGAAQ